MRPLSALKRMSIRATDGDIGAVHDTLFDDEAWISRYLVVDTRRWLPGRKVLISPFSVRSVDWDDGVVEVSVTREQVKNSPDIDTDQPVSRQHETSLLDYYAYPYYWGGTLAWGALPYPAFPPQRTGIADLSDTRKREKESADPHLRSLNAVLGYRIEANDGRFGHLDDFLFDEQSWAQRYFVVDTRDWLPGRRVVVSTEWVREISWEGRTISVDLDRDAIRRSPQLNAEQAFTPDDELAVYQHYGRSPGSAPIVRAQIR